MNIPDAPQQGTPIRRVLDALESAGCDPRKRGNGWQACCPAHDDRSPSLSVGVGDDGRVLLCCHAGCDSAAVVDVLRMKWRDLMPAETLGPAWRPVRKGVRYGNR